MIPELKMRERELKKEWIEAAKETKQRQRGREHRDKVNLVKWDEMWGEVFWHFEWNWAEVGLVLSQMVRSAFFFFFLNFGLNRPFRPIRPIQARVGPIPGESAWVEAASAQVGENHVGSTWHDAVGRGCGTPGAASVLPRLSLKFGEEYFLLIG